MSDPVKELVELRELIENLDKRLIVILSTRLALSVDFARVKQELKLRTKDTDRETILHQMYEQWATERDVEPKLVHRIFDLVLKASRNRQHDYLRENELKNHVSFKEAVSHGDATPEDEEDWIERWHASDSTITLQQYLGYSKEEYQKFLTTRGD